MPKNNTPEPGTGSVTHLPIGSIKVDRTVQQRVEMDAALVEDYAADLADWIEFSPVVVFDDGASAWLADGFHRAHAAGRIEMETVPALVYRGTRRDATLYAIGANRTHGLRRTNADKRRAVETLLSDPEWSAWSDRRIAEKVGISPTTVGTIRAQLSKLDTPKPPQTQPPPEPQTDPVGNFPTCERSQPRIQPEPPAGQVSKLDTCEPESPAARVETLPPAETPPEPAKRIGRDGKARPATQPPARKKDQNKARVAMQAAHAVTAALGRLLDFDRDLLESDARTLIANLRGALERLDSRFPVKGDGNDA
jgi:hypothetical protein